MAFHFGINMEALGHMDKGGSGSKMRPMPCLQLFQIHSIVSNINSNVFFFPTVGWPCFQILSSPMFGGENLEWLANSRKSGCFLPHTAGYLNMKRSNAMMIQRRTISTSCGIKESEPIPPSYPGSGDNGE